MLTRNLFILLLFHLFNLSINAAEIGTWNAYMAYHDVTEIEKAGNILYVLASNNLYAYNTNDQSIQTYDKSNFLSDCFIEHIAYCQGAKRLIITYENCNIDLLEANNNVINMSEYYNKSMTGEKTINDLYIHGNYVYISTGFGIIKLNATKAEISDTYNLGFSVNYCYIENNNIYAASREKGIYSANLSSNLLDKSNWNRISSYKNNTKTLDSEQLKLIQTLKPGGPKHNYFGAMTFTNGQLYTCGGGYGDGYDLHRDAAIQVMKNGDWTIFEDSLESKTGVRFQDMMALDIDPTNVSRVMTSGKSGLYEFRNGQFYEHFTTDNSPLRSAIADGNKNYVLTTGIGFDKSGNLWCLNSQSPGVSLLEYTKEGEWKTFNLPETMSGTNSLGMLECIYFDSRGLLWFVNNHSGTPALFCYNPTTEELQSWKSFINEDGTRIALVFVRCVTEDKLNNIWVATNMGPLMIPAANIPNNIDEFVQVKVPRNDGTNFADYLLDGIDVTSIAIDGGNRKWFGTNENGLYLISADNMEQVQHFTSLDSDLLSDNIESLAINDVTGEVFIGTDKGLCSYMSDATQTFDEMTKENVYAYPNPVRPDYTGLITITGLTYNADIKIVTSNGVLVAEGRSNGGTFTWNGCDRNGKRVVSGVYMVETATQEGKKGVVCKIAIVR
ncbi:MAG: Por secretion system protein [Prevotella sp.]|nr:Por secretion system protein [Prevotella sp.]